MRSAEDRQTDCLQGIAADARLVGWKDLELERGRRRQIGGDGEPASVEE